MRSGFNYMSELFLIVSSSSLWISDLYFAVALKFVASSFRMTAIVMCMCIYRRTFVVLILLILCNYHEYKIRVYYLREM